MWPPKKKAASDNDADDGPVKFTLASNQKGPTPSANVNVPTMFGGKPKGGLKFKTGKKGY